MKKILFTLAVATILCGQSGFAAGTNEVTDGLNAVVVRVNAKIQQGLTAEKDYDAELKDFDALYAKYKDLKTEDVAQILVMKAKLYLEVVNPPAGDREKAVEVFQQIKSDMPETDVGKKVDDILASLKRPVEANAGLTIDMSKISVLDTNRPPVNLPAEIIRAKTENKLLLLEFGSSDSCPPCILFEQKVFSTPEFKAYEKSNLDFVRLDYPLRHELPPDMNATNILLAQQFEASAFPTFVAIDKNGKEFWRMPGKNDPNAVDLSLFAPKNFIALLESVKAKEN